LADNAPLKFCNFKIYTRIQILNTFQRMHFTREDKQTTVAIAFVDLQGHICI